MQGDPWAHFYWAALASATPRRAHGPDSVSFQDVANAYNQPHVPSGATAPTNAAEPKTTSTKPQAHHRRPILG